MKKTRLFSMLSVLAVSATMLTANLTANAANMSNADNGVLVTSDIWFRILIYYTGTLTIGAVCMIAYRFLQMRRYDNEL